MTLHLPTAQNNLLAPSALDWVASSARRPAVVTLSLGVPAGNWSSALEEAVRSVIVKRCVCRGGAVCLHSTLSLPIACLVF
jgi:hypothetical protein